MDCLESKISNQTPLIRKLYYVHRIDDAELLRKLNAVNICHEEGIKALIFFLH